MVPGDKQNKFTVYLDELDRYKLRCRNCDDTYVIEDNIYLTFLMSKPVPFNRLSVKWYTLKNFINVTKYISWHECGVRHEH